MATIVNDPGTTTESQSGMGIFLGIIVLIAFLFMVLYFGLPALNRTPTGSSSPSTNNPPSNNSNQEDTNINLPNQQSTTSQEKPDVNIPDQVDINLNLPTSGQQPASPSTSP